MDVLGLQHSLLIQSESENQFHITFIYTASVHRAKPDPNKHSALTYPLTITCCTVV